MLPFTYAFTARIALPTFITAYPYYVFLHLPPYSKICHQAVSQRIDDLHLHQ